jgi:quercetin dioxygenase-like cupin family protein
MTAVFAGLFVAVSAVPGIATAGSGFVPTLLGHGKLAHGSLRVNPNGEVVVTKNDVVPGGFSGWHSHPGGAIVVVQSGQITTYRVVKNDDEEDRASSRCVITNYKAGDAFIERPGEPLDAVNNGSTATVIYATFPGVPALGQQRTEQPKPNPDPCPV